MNTRLTMLWIAVSLGVCQNVFATKGGAVGFDFLQTDRFGNEINASRSICGVDATSPMIEEDEDFQKFGHPIGQYREMSASGGMGRCTGTLISPDLFLTARHCIQRGCEFIEVAFNFHAQRDEQEIFKCAEVVEKGGASNQDDYLILRLEGKPGVRWGYYAPAAEPVKNQQALMMIHHPKGKPMQVSWDGCEVKETKENMLHHRCDTEPGSSGSGILTQETETPNNVRVVGVHTLGGCMKVGQTSSNSGPLMSHLLTLSPTLSSLAKK